MKNRFWKKTAAGLLALLIIAGAAPVKPVTDLFGGAAITASAEGEIEGVTYIDENGEEQTISEYTVLDENTTELTEGWYVVDSSFTNPNTLKPSGNVNIILTDDHTMDLGGDGEYAFSGADETTTNLTIYGQSKGTGKIVLSSFPDGTSVYIKGSLTINGGTWISDEIDVEGTDPGEDCLTFNGGNINIGGCYYSLDFEQGKCSINGGQVVLNSWHDFGFWSPDSTLYLGYTKATDLIYTKNPLSDGANVRIADGMVFTDGTNIYDSSTPSETLSALTGVTLTPANAHNITAAPAENGTVTVPTKAFAGDTVTLSVAPDAGHTLRSVTVKDADGNAIPVSKDQFTMPEGDVTVTAEFEVLEEFPADGILIIGTKYAFTPDEDGVYSFNITNATEGQALLIKGADGVIADIQSAHLKAGETYIIRVNDLPTIGDPGQAEVTWEKLTSYNINIPDPVENGAIKLYKVKNTALYDTTDTLALAGDEMAIVATPEEVCDLKELTVTAGGSPLELTEKELVTSEGAIVYYSFTMPAEDVTVTAEFEKPISSASLTLGDDLGLNFYMSSAITDENAADYTVKFEGECLENEATLTKNESSGKYYATAHVYAKNLDKKITAKLYKGEEVICTTEYSVADYLEKAPETVTDEKALALIKATKAFGAMSADYFYEGEHGFSAAYNEYLTQSGLTDADIVNNAKNNYATEFTTDDAKISLVLDEKTAIRLYVKGVQPDGENLKPSKQANKDVYPSYYEIAGLTPDKLADEQTVTIGGVDHKFSALSWANRILNQEDPSEKNRNMAKAVTAYYLAAHYYYLQNHPVDLSALTENYEAKDGDTLTGTLGENVKISVADGATVTLKDVTINGVHDENYQWAGITCNGDAKLILEGENNVKGFYWIYPGVYIAPEKTLIIDGTGSLNASSLGGAGIGGGNQINCGNITINGGTVSANGGEGAAGIGGGSYDSCGNIVINGGTVTANGGVMGAGIGSPDGSTCGDITINGGTVTAKGGALGAGIGCAYYSECGNITIADTVTKVTATKSDDAPNSIGATSQGACGTVTIGGNVYYENGAYVNGGDTYLAQDTIVYEVIDLSKLTEDYTAKNGNILTGELKENVQISVADGATVTLKDVTINGVNDDAYKWAGISCDGNAKLILEGKNNVKGFYKYYPGVYIAPEKTLTIDGTGTLNASSNGYGAGIGGGDDISSGNIVIDGGVINASGGGEAAGIGGAHKSKCGNITINSGTITATGGYMAAGIGSGNYGSCTYITINGGTVTAIGGNGAAGIGSGHFGKCSDITISDIVTKVIATKGSESPNSIGAGYGGSCGTVTIADGANVEQN